MEEKKSSWLVSILVGVCFVLTMYAYWPGQLSLLGLSDAFYNTIGMFLMSYTEGPDPEKAYLLHALRLACPLSLCTVAMSLFTTWVDRLVLQLRSLGRSSVAIYGTGELAHQAAEGTRFLAAGEYFLPFARQHVILMESDEKSLDFFRRHRDALSRNNTIVGLGQMSSYLMKGLPNVSYFNVQEETARAYWKQYPLEVGAIDCQVVLLGYRQDDLGYQLLRYGLMNNLFREGQKIRYHVFCPEAEAYRGFETLEMMNGDEIHWHRENWQSCPGVLRGADRVILSRQVSPGILNQLLQVCTRQQIDYYAPHGEPYPQNYQYSRLRPFGCIREILSEDAILKDRLYADARNRHYQYTRENGSEEEKRQIQAARDNGTEDVLKRALWSQLSGFLKQSNAASADYYESHPVNRTLSRTALEERAKLEHIRWCRFHYLCGWRYGQPETGTKDREARLHACLVPWEALSEEEREKDRQQVQMEMR